MIKTLHVFCAYATGVLFVLRGAMMLAGTGWHRTPWARIPPVLVDTTLLLMGVIMAIQLPWSYLQGWLPYKLVALVAYILLGMWALKWARGRGQQLLALIAAFLTYVYIIAVAHGHNPLPW